MDIIELYKVLLANAGMKADDEGFISANLTDTMKDPILIDDKRMVLPTANQLATPNMGNRVMFHPLHESLIRGESEVMAETRRMAGARLNIAFTYIGLCLLQLATSPAEHANLTPDQTIFLDNLKDIDEGIMDVYAKLMQNMAVGEDGHSFLRIFIKRGGKIGGKAVQRLAVVTFPFYEELINRPEPGKNNMIWGVRVKKAEREALIKLVEYMVPFIAIPEHYNRGSDSTVAPTVDAFMQAIGGLGTQINDMLDLFGEGIIQDSETMRYPMDWVETFRDLRKIQAKINMIPAQPGNEGSLPNTGRKQIEIPEVSVTVKEPLPWEGPNEFTTNQTNLGLKHQEPPAPAPEPAKGLFIRPADVPTAVAPAPAPVVINRPVQAIAPVSQYRPAAAPMHQPMMQPQTVVNPYLPQQMQFAAAQVMYGPNAGFGNPGYQQQPRQHRPSWDRSGLPGYSSGYGQGGGGFSNI